MIEWPWGVAPLPDYLAIGRDPAFSELAALIDAFPNVSRRHAEIRRVGASFVVRDHGSTNGTFVDDQAISSERDVSLQDGSTLRFARSLTAKIRFTR